MCTYLVCPHMCVRIICAVLCVRTCVCVGMFCVWQKRFFSVRRERVEQRMSVGKFFDFVNFNDSLPSRELAYTVNLASRGGVTNEAFWNRVKQAYLINSGMNTKFETQVFVGLARAGVVDRAAVTICLDRLARRCNEFRFCDLVHVMHALCKQQNEIVWPNCVWDRLLTEHSSDSRLLAMLTTVLGKCTHVSRHRVMEHFAGQIASLLDEFDQFEIAAIIRGYQTLGGRPDLVNKMLSKVEWTELESGTYNIILHSLALNPKNLQLHQVFSVIQTHTCPDLLPYIFLSAVQLNAPAELLCAFGSRLIRNYKQIKAESMPIVYEGFHQFAQANLTHADATVLGETGTRLAESVVDKFLLMSSPEEKFRLLESKQARQSLWFRAKLENNVGTVVRVFTKLDLMKQLWAETDRSKHTELLAQIEACDGPIDDHDLYYSLFFRFLLKSGLQITSVSFDPKLCSHKTICRYLQLWPDSPEILAISLDRIEELLPNDVSGYLDLLIKNSSTEAIHYYREKIECKITRELVLMKSSSVKSRIVAKGAILGLDFTDHTEGYEALLAQ